MAFNKEAKSFLHLVLEHKRRYNGRKENVHQSNKVVEAMGKATVYYIMHTEKCVAQVSEIAALLDKADYRKLRLVWIYAKHLIEKEGASA